MKNSGSYYSDGRGGGCFRGFQETEYKNTTKLNEHIQKNRKNLERRLKRLKERRRKEWSE